MTEHKVAEPEQILAIKGEFSNYDRADEGYDYLTELGYDQNHILVALPEKVGDKVILGKTPSQIISDAEQGPEATALEVEKTIRGRQGKIVGSSVGAMAGLIALIGISAILTIMGVAFLHPFAAGLVGVVGGAALGWLTGLFYQDRKPETEWPYYPSELKTGKTLISVTPRSMGDAERISARWEGLGADLSLG